MPEHHVAIESTGSSKRQLKVYWIAQLEQAEIGLPQRLLDDLDPQKRPSLLHYCQAGPIDRHAVPDLKLRPYPSAVEYEHTCFSRFLDGVDSASSLDNSCEHGGSLTYVSF